MQGSRIQFYMSAENFHKNLWNIPQTESPKVEYLTPFLGEMLCVKW